MRTVRRLRVLLIGSVLVCSMTATVQTDTALMASRQVCGTVIDPTNTPIPNANLLVLRGHKKVATTRTDSRGLFSFHKLASGNYELQVRAFAFSMRQYRVAVGRSGGCRNPLILSLRLAPLQGPVEVAPPQKLNCGRIGIH